MPKPQTANNGMNIQLSTTVRAVDDLEQPVTILTAAISSFFAAAYPPFPLGGKRLLCGPKNKKALTLKANSRVIPLLHTLNIIKQNT
jgi:hypothetical protein